MPANTALDVNPERWELENQLIGSGNFSSAHPAHQELDAAVDRIWLVFTP